MVNLPRTQRVFQLIWPDEVSVEDAYASFKYRTLKAGGCLLVFADRLESGSLDTNVSVAAICGLVGAAEGILALENRTIAGKIAVYPACKGLGLTELGQLRASLPEVAKCLSDGVWNKKAEDVFLAGYS
jgi:hypothetical protein